MSIQTIAVKDSPLLLQLPETVDTNFVYPMYWDDEKNSWQVFEIPISSYEEWLPF